MREGKDEAAAIGPLRPGQEPEWRRLWQAYLDFYEATLAPDVTDRLWGALVAGEGPWHGYGATMGTELVGFAIVIVHPATWSLAQTAYLEDLFVRSEVRGRGAGRSLIDAILADGRTLGWSSVYWHTRADNRAARALYDRFTPADDFVRYRVELGERP